MKKFKEHEHTVCICVFSHYHVQIVFTNDLVRSLKKRKETCNIEDVDATNAITVHVKGELRSLVFYELKPTGGDVSHESWHIANRICKFLQIAIDSETIAYLIGFLVEETTWYKTHKKRKRA